MQYELLKRKVSERKSALQMRPGAPIITPETYDRLSALYRTDYNAAGAAIAASRGGEIQQTPYEIALKIKSDYLRMLQDGKQDSMASGVVSQMSEWIGKRYSRFVPPVLVKEAASVGMTLVIAAFHLNFSHLGHRQEFVDNLANMAPQHLQRVIAPSSATPFEDRIAEIDRIAKNEREIPSYQEELARFIRMFVTKFAPFEEPLADTAAKTYDVLDQSWELLVPKSIQYVDKFTISKSDD